MQVDTIFIKNEQYKHFQIRVMYIFQSADETFVHQRQQEETKSHNAEQGWNFVPVDAVAADDGNVETDRTLNRYPTAFPYGNGMVLHFYQQQESSTTKTVHKVINKRLKTYV